MRKPRTDWARAEAEKFLEEIGCRALPIDPFEIARREGIEVEPKPSEAPGVSGMLVKVGDAFGIMYATHVDNEGFQRFSVSHELGHYVLDGHTEQLFSGVATRHVSRAGFGSGDPIELEADHFASGLLMPRSLFVPLMERSGEGFAAIERLATKCKTSLTSTAIQYATFSEDPVAVVVSQGSTVCYAFMSQAFKTIPGMGNWLKKNQTVPKDTPTFFFNADPGRVAGAEKIEESSALRDWFGGETDFELNEDVVGLGDYGRTLTVLFPSEEIDFEDEEEDSWDPPTFRRSRRR